MNFLSAHKSPNQTPTHQKFSAFESTCNTRQSRRLPNTSATPFKFEHGSKSFDFEQISDYGSDQNSKLTGSTRYSSDSDYEESHFNLNLSPSINHTSSAPLAVSQPQLKT
jgi:hypothetical protein